MISTVRSDPTIRFAGWWNRTLARAGALAALALVSACEPVARLQDQLFDNRSPRERYEAGLDLAGLAGTALVREWRTAAERALAEAPTIVAPHVEEGFLDPAAPAAFAYRVRVERGQEVSFSMEVRGDTTAQVFLEVWQVADSVGTLRRAAVSDSGTGQLAFEPRRSGEYVFRAQPELLRGGRFSVALRLAPTLAFPVLRGDNNDIGSLYGADRDGGARSHQGIDIFARRGTPVLATGPAVVARVGEDRLGGLVVWLRDERGNRLYYAHLDSQAVYEGQRLLAGDTVGFVGNTGNARTTPPHLHFGVYRRGEGPLDPRWFVARLNGRSPRLTADTVLLGGWARTMRAAAVLEGPAPGAVPRFNVPLHTAVQVLAATAGWYRVRLPDGGTGYVNARNVQGATSGVGSYTVDRELSMAKWPDAGSGAGGLVALLPAGGAVTVLGRFGPHLLVRTAAGVAGWISPAAAAAAAD